MIQRVFVYELELPKEPASHHDSMFRFLSACFPGSYDLVVKHPTRSPTDGSSNAGLVHKSATEAFSRQAADWLRWCKWYFRLGDDLMYELPWILVVEDSTHWTNFSLWVYLMTWDLRITSTIFLSHLRGDLEKLHLHQIEIKEAVKGFGEGNECEKLYSGLDVLKSSHILGPNQSIRSGELVYCKAVILAISFDLFANCRDIVLSCTEWRVGTNDPWYKQRLWESTNCIWDVHYC